MTKQNFDINNLRVASPCSVGWETMAGDEHRRFCDLCKLNVYNFSEMTAEEVRQLVAKGEGRICGRLYKRADGTVLTKDCPVGLRAYQKRVARFAGTALTAILGLLSVSFGQKADEKSVDASKIKIARTLISTQKSFLTGTITDENGAVIPGVEITLTGDDKSQFAAQTDGDGVYFISSLTKGIYALKIKSQRGFKEFEVKKIEINDNEKTELNLNLKVDSESVNLGVVVAVTESNITKEMIENLPVNKNKPTEQLRFKIISEKPH